jgi:hypothetical protein
MFLFPPPTPATDTTPPPAHPNSAATAVERSIGTVQKPLWYLDADALTRSRYNDLGWEVTSRLREEWGKLGEWRESFPDYEGLLL